MKAMIRRLSSTVLLAVMAITVTTSSAKQQAAATFLAVVRDDGALVPIAIYDGHDWWNRWPWAGEGDAEIKALPLPRSFDAIPADWVPPGVRLPAKWRLLRKDGRTVAVRAIRPARPSDFDLMETVVITTDYRPRSGDTTGDEIGIAVGGPGELGRFVDPPAAESQRVLDRLKDRLDALEREEIARWRKEEESSGERGPVTLTPTQRKGDNGPPFGLTKAADRVDGRTYYFLGGTKLFAMNLKDQPDCKMNLSFDGVVIAGADGAIVSDSVSASAYAGYCGDATGGMSPLATLRLGDRVWWIVRNSLEDGYYYDLFDPEKSETLELKGRWDLRR